MTYCTAASYQTRAEIIAARRMLVRRNNLPLSIYHCETCDKYHFKAETGKYPFTEKWTQIIQYLALGYRFSEIGPMVGMKRYSVQVLTYDIQKSLYALSLANLVAISLSLGVIQPNEFIPQLEERKHA